MKLDGRRLRSQQLRNVNFQGDALRMGMNWTEEDLGKPQILVDSAYGMGHPGTFHFRPLIQEISNGVFGLDNVIVTPHAAYSSEESIRLVCTIASNEVVRVLTGQLPRSPVNVVEHAERDSA